MMKKTILLLFAFMATITAFGQNLALNKAAIATSGTASNAVDGNTTGTRWESAQSDPQTWQVDLGSEQTFNRLVIVWEAAYGKSFVIKAGNTVGDDRMITVRVTPEQLSVTGHANYGPMGRDIVCAAVSMLTQTLIESVQRLTEDKISDEIRPGRTVVNFRDPSESLKLLIDSFFVGILMLVEAYPQFVKIDDQA